MGRVRTIAEKPDFCLYGAAFGLSAAIWLTLTVVILL